MQPNFNASLESDILRLSKEVRQRQETMPSPDLSQREIVHAVIREKIQAQPALAPQSAPASSVLPHYLQSESPEVQLKVEELASMAFQKGIDVSIAEAKKYGPFILDALHDTLTSKLYDELKARKLI